MPKTISFRLSSLLWCITLVCIVAFYWHHNSLLKREVQRLNDQIETYDQINGSFVDLDLPLTPTPDGSFNFSGTTQLP